MGKGHHAGVLVGGAFSNGSAQLMLRHTEHTFNAGEIADGDLRMGLFHESGSLVERFPFNKQATDSIYPQALLFQNRVSSSDHRAIQPAQ